ncbi:MAG: zf-HC2 domain-containing protein [Isosphaeraceae bacterium]|nr:zf-HC2 domain-containing protein [Isosphaeraceae bacterium]
MNLDDESLLTAYLDGELSPSELLRVEAALRSDPSLAKRLSELARVRSLVAGLSHPLPPFDLSATIVQRLSSSPVHPSVFTRPGPRRASYAEVALCAAAVILATGFIGYLSLLRDMHAPARPAGQVPVAVAPVPPSTVSPVVTERATARPRAVASTKKSPRVSPREASARLAPEDQEQFQAMIDSPNLKRIFFVVDAVGGHAEERVGELVDSLPRADSLYACMTIGPNVVVDPKHPGGAKVFAVALTDPELRQVRDDLSKTFPGAVEEADPEPSVVVQLAEINYVSLLPGTAVADLENPAAAEARIAAVKRRHEGDPEEVPEEPEPGPTPEQLRSAPATFVDRRQSEKEGSPLAAAPASGMAPVSSPVSSGRVKPTIVLIWVASR